MTVITAIANTILGIVQNLEDETEAKEFARLYVKALNCARVAIHNDEIDENEIFEIIGATDARF